MHRAHRRESRHRARRRHPGRVGALGAAATVAVGVAWVGVTGWMASAELDAVRDGAPVLRAQLLNADIAAARRSADVMTRQAARAHDLTGGPAWTLIGKLPFLGEPFRTARGITAVADELGRNALPQLVQAATTLDPHHLRSEQGRIDLAALREAAPALDSASASLARAVAATEQLPGGTYLSSVDRARHGLLEELRPLARLVDSTSRASSLLPRMLGAEEPQTYFLAFQNNAEARGTGGLPGAFALLRAARGNIEFLGFHSDAELAGVRAGVRFDRDYETLYRNAGTKTLFLNSNLSPHFPYAAQIWADMWRRHSGQRVDGALAVDPQVLSYLLAVTGPATLADGTTISADNVVALTQNAAYVRFAGDDVARKRFLLQIARAAAEKVTGAAGDAGALGRALARAAGERRLLAWSADPELQAVLEGTALSGVVPASTDPYAGLTIINEGGNKLDYYLERSLTWHRSGCGRDRTVTVTVELLNAAPADVSPHVAPRSDRPRYDVNLGDNRIWMYYAATAGAVARSVTINGEAVSLSAGTERGHPVFLVEVELPRGAVRTVVLNLEEPAAPGAPHILRQPLVRPLAVTVRDDSC